jgi:hypothetical protein
MSALPKEGHEFVIKVNKRTHNKPRAGRHITYTLELVF